MTDLPESSPPIEARGIRVHNLKSIAVSIPSDRIVGLCGVSGSGKSSLAFDCLYAESRRRYLETLSPGVRKLLDRLPPPDADRIEHLPPAFALREEGRKLPDHAMLATAISLHDHLAGVFARVGRVVCPECDREIRREGPADVLADLNTLPEGTRYLLGFEVPFDDPKPTAAGLIAEGFDRVVLAGETRSLRTDAVTSEPSTFVVVDRLVSGRGSEDRLADSVELAYLSGGDRCVALIAVGDRSAADDASHREIDGRTWEVRSWSGRLVCERCDRAFLPPEPRLFRPSSPYAACEACRGTGSVTVPTATGGSMVEPCEACDGTRLRPEARAVRVGSRTISDVLAGSIGELGDWLTDWTRSASEPHRQLTAALRVEIEREIAAVTALDLSRLPLDRRWGVLSDGERSRLALVSSIGSRLAGALLILDEPATALHPLDRQRVFDLITDLRNDGNGIILVEHAIEMISRCEHVIELGPGAGSAGGEIVFTGSPTELSEAPTPTGRVVRGEDAPTPKNTPRSPRGHLTLTGCRAKNLRDLILTLPLGSLCVFAGVSGSGKTALLRDELLPALAEFLDRENRSTDRTERLTISGDGSFDAVTVIDRTPPGRQGRSNPVTYIKAFDDIRRIFAETPEANRLGFSPSEFSFNSAAGGRCPRCRGAGQITLDLEFLPDVTLDCPDCGGSRYRSAVLGVKYRSRSIADVLAMTVDEAFAFFRGEVRLQKRLQALRDVGLGYLPLGQSTATLSGGEVQRLKLASHFGSLGGKRQIFLIDEPASGLHPADVPQLLGVLDGLVDVGHTVIVAEQNERLILAADHLIELGPGSDHEGGTILAAGSVPEVLANGGSLWRRVLASGAKRNGE